MDKFVDLANEIKQSGEFNGEILLNEPMSKHTTFKIGGEVPVLFEPEDLDSLLILLLKIKNENIRFFVLGGGSNVVFCDETFEGVVVSLLKLNKIEVVESESISQDEVLISCGAGATISQLVNFCTKNAFSGCEQFAGLPGTVGGALFMNARCFDRSISDLFVDAWYIDLETYTEQHKTFNSKEWEYKVSPFQNDKTLILNATFRLYKGKKTEEEITQDNKKYIQERKSKGHFDYPSAGSVFRNNHTFGSPSGKLIDEAGLRGTQCGGAQIAPFHGNFIINIGGATQKDVKTLVEIAVNRVREKFGFCLEPEIIFVDSKN